MRKILLLLCLIWLLSSCAFEAGLSAPVETEPLTAPVVSVTVPVAATSEAAVWDEAPVPPAGIVLHPVHSGMREQRCADAVIDYSHTEDGYLMACYTSKTEQRLKLRIYGPVTTYTYNLPVDMWTAFPLSDGDGAYQVAIYMNTHDSKYALVMTTQFDVVLSDEFAPFLRPNQYVDYETAEQTVQMGAQLCAGLERPLEKVAAVYDFVVSTLTYDTQRAATVKSGYLPVLDQVLAEKKGICFDYAALMTAMLRSQGIPCKLVVGYAGMTYHAWISVWTEENGWIDGAIFFDGKTWVRMDPTFASSGERNAEIMDYIENGTYTAKYLY